MVQRLIASRPALVSFWFTAVIVLTGCGSESVERTKAKARAIVQVIPTETGWIPFPTATATATPTPIETGYIPPPKTPTPRPTQEIPPTQIPPTQVPPTQIPPTQVPPTQVPPTQVPPTQVPPTQVPPTQVPPTQVPPTQVPPTQVPPTHVPTAVPTQIPPTAVPVTEACTKEKRLRVKLNASDVSREERLVLTLSLVAPPMDASRGELVARKVDFRTLQSWPRTRVMSFDLQQTNFFGPRFEQDLELPTAVRPAGPGSAPAEYVISVCAPTGANRDCLAEPESAQRSLHLKVFHVCPHPRAVVVTLTERNCLRRHDTEDDEEDFALETGRGRGR